MLVITRRPGEDIIIRTPEGRVVTVRAIRIAGDRVRIGVDADRSVKVNREEIDREIQAANAGA